LYPVGALDRAQSRLISRLVDLYVLVPVHALVLQIRAEPHDEAVVARHLGATKALLAQVDSTVSQAPWCLGEKPMLADCALAAALWYLPNTLRYFSKADLRDGYSRLTPY
jgi:glutathione S-transferase